MGPAPGRGVVGEPAAKLLERGPGGLLGPPELADPCRRGGGFVAGGVALVLQARAVRGRLCVALLGHRSNVGQHPAELGGVALEVGLALGGGPRELRLALARRLLGLRDALDGHLVGGGLPLGRPPLDFGRPLGEGQLLALERFGAPGRRITARSDLFAQRGELVP